MRYVMSVCLLSCVNVPFISTNPQTAHDVQFMKEIYLRNVGIFLFERKASIGASKIFFFLIIQPQKIRNDT